MELSRLSITEDPDVFTTPLVVWEEIAKAHGIDVDWEEDKDEQASYTQRLLRTIKQHPVKVQAKITADDLQSVYTYVSAGKSLEFKDTSQLFERLEFMQNLPHLVTIRTEVDQAIPEGIKACAAYKYCKQIGVPLTRDTSLDEMYFGITVWRENTKVIAKFTEVCIKLADRNIISRDMSKGILRVLWSINSTLKKPNYQDLSLAHSEMSQPGKYKSNFKNLDQLICLTARRYQVNINRFKYPLLVYAKLAEGQDNGIVRYLKNILDEDLPPVYSEEQLLHMIKIMGLIPEGQDVGTYFSQISNFSLTVDTFYPLTHLTTPHSVKTTAVDHADVSTLSRADLLAYGTTLKVKYILSYDELARTLEHNGTYNNFLDTDRRRSGDFDECVVKRIRYLAEEHGQTHLSTIISHIDNKKNEDAKTWTSLREVYKKAPDEAKQMIIKILRTIIDLGMYMRGWKGGDEPYPIENAPPNAKQHETDESVWKSMHAIEEMESWFTKQGRSEEIKLIMDLPLYRYNSDKAKFCKPPGEDSCKTLKQRIELAKKGDRPGVSSDSCIRMSSNYIIGTTYYALQFIGSPLPFSIVMLRYIT